MTKDYPDIKWQKPYTLKRKWLVCWTRYEVWFEDTNLIFSIYNDRETAEGLVGALNGAYNLGYQEAELIAYREKMRLKMLLSSEYGKISNEHQTSTEHIAD